LIIIPAKFIMSATDYVFWLIVFEPKRRINCPYARYTANKLASWSSGPPNEVVESEIAIKTKMGNIAVLILSSGSLIILTY